MTTVLGEGGAVTRASDRDVTDDDIGATRADLGPSGAAAGTGAEALDPVDTPACPDPTGTPAPPDPHAEFDAFMVASGPALGRLALFLAGDVHRAEELLQQTFVRTWSAWPRVRDGDPHAYARRVMANQRVDTWRRRRREALTAPDDLPEQPVPDGGQHVADRDQLVRALRALPERRRRVVVLRYLVGLSENEAATTLGVTAGTVKSTAARGLAQLRAVLEQEEVS